MGLGVREVAATRRLAPMASLVVLEVFTEVAAAVA
jgi:hypothetical protein